MKRILLIEIFSVGILVAVLHKIALALSLYWTVSWFDILMHFLGGALIALITLYFIYDKNVLAFKDSNRFLIFYFALSTVLIIGLAWELWELYMNFSDIYTDALDSLGDLVMDVLGAIVIFFYSHKKIKNYLSENLENKPN